jgi:biopolymer transport protein ExbB
MNTFGIEQSVASWYGALIMAILAILSIYGLTLAIVRWHFFRGLRVNTETIVEETKKILASDSKGHVLPKGQRAWDPPQWIMAATCLNNRHLAEVDLKELLGITQTRQKQRLEQGLSAFGTMASIGPFVGLLATVLGIIESFHNLAGTGAAGPNVVSSGVAAALWGTAAGLAVAIPAVLAYNIFNKKARAIGFEMDILSRELMLLFKLEKQPNKGARLHEAHG